MSVDKTHYTFASDWIVDGSCSANCGRKRRDANDDPWNSSLQNDSICTVYRW